MCVWCVRACVYIREFLKIVVKTGYAFSIAVVGHIYVFLCLVSVYLLGTFCLSGIEFYAPQG